ncbi:hypothetical protein, partial [Faecalibaculum rodentium]|uniref:hypothetical protein n=1 Tax=Faecalibaculum rodentium TaxID=1702221 RepID=UPI002605914E
VLSRYGGICHRWVINVAYALETVSGTGEQISAPELYKKKQEKAIGSSRLHHCAGPGKGDGFLCTAEVWPQARSAERIDHADPLRSGPRFRTGSQVFLQEERKPSVASVDGEAPAGLRWSHSDKNLPSVMQHERVKSPGAALPLYRIARLQYNAM